MFIICSRRGEDKYSQNYRLAVLLVYDLVLLAHRTAVTLPWLAVSSRLPGVAHAAASRAHHIPPQRSPTASTRRCAGAGATRPATRAAFRCGCRRRPRLHAGLRVRRCRFPSHGEATDDCGARGLAAAAPPSEAVLTDPWIRRPSAWIAAGSRSITITTTTTIRSIEVVGEWIGRTSSMNGLV